MAYVNLPISLSGMFDDLDERLARVETVYSGPQESADAAQATAVSAQALALTSQSTASSAQVQAINAGIQANLAYSQATIAQSQATIASSQAVAAQTSANGKNTIHYSTSSPSGSGTNVGDIWWQYSGSTLIGQWSWNGSSWNPAPITNAVIANLDAGKITTGILNAIEINAGTGGTAFHVSPSGYMSAQGVYIKGNITADSGTFNGTINAQTGYFGGYGTTGNYWSIGSSGITGVGSATITAGQINGSSINIGSGTFQVDASGNLNASSATVTGTITTSNLTATGGHIGGFTIGSTYLSGSGSFFLNSSTGDSTFNSVNIGLTGVYYFSSTGALSASTVNTTGTLNVGTTAFISGSTEVAGNFQVDSVGSVTYNSTNYNIGLFGTGSGGTQAGRMYKTTSVSSKRFKHNIQSFAERDYLSIVSKLNPVTFNYNSDVVDNPEVTAYGLIAEDVQEIPQTEELVNIGADGLPESIAYDRLQWYVIKSISQINDRLTKLEGK